MLDSNSGILKIADFGLARPLDVVSKNPRYTATVVTRWYRAPELLLGERCYTTAVDIWSCGCVYGELVAGKPILQGSYDEDQKAKIWELCGEPNSTSWPGWEKTEGVKGVVTNFKPHSRKTVDEFHRWMKQRG